MTNLNSDLNFAACGQLHTACKLCGSFASDTKWGQVHCQALHSTAFTALLQECIPSYLFALSFSSSSISSFTQHRALQGKHRNAHWEYSLILLRTQNMEGSGLYLKTSWMFQYFPSQIPLLVCLSLLVESAAEAWEVRLLLHAPTSSYNNRTLKGKI